MNDARDLAAAFAGVTSRRGGGTMDLRSLLPEQMLIEAGEGSRLRACLAAVSESAYATAMGQMQAYAGGMVNGSNGYRVQGRVGVIDVRGVMSRRFSLWGLLFGAAASTEYVLGGLNGALADESVKKILLDFATPGGDVEFLDEVAEAIYAARKIKPVIAFASGKCASAGYWLACQAEKVFAASNAEVGSIGIRCSIHSDERYEKNMGFDSRHFASTPAKLGMSDAAIQQVVDDLAANFTAAVARGRGISVPEAMALSDALVYVGQRAVDRGLADGVTTLQALIGQMQEDIETPPIVAFSLNIDPPCDDMAARAGSAGTETRVIAQPEETMGDQTPNVEALVQRLDALEAKDKDQSDKIAALETEGAALKAKSDATASTVATVTADRDADRLVADLKGETGGPVKLAALDEDGEKVVRDRVAAKGAEEARGYFTRTLAVLGKGAESVVKSGAGAAGAGVPAGRNHFDVFGPAKWSGSADPVMQAYGRKIEWIDAAEKAGQKFRTAADAFAAYGAAHKSAA